MEERKQSQREGPLAGVRVLDLSRILAGPTCTQLLGDMGAEVIKIERPEAGDDTRSWGPPFIASSGRSENRESAYYLSSNRNKKSVAIDIASPDGAEKIRKLAAKSDVLIENFKVGGLEKYGLAYSDVKELAPHLVYCSITGYGQTGPNAHKPGYDLLAQAYGGYMSLTGAPDGEPTKVGVGVADVMCGLYASSAILAALHHRDITGEGQHIDIALVDVQIAALVNEGVNHLLSGRVPERRGNQHPNIVPYQVFECLDGHAIVAVGNDRQFERFCDLIEMPELALDERYSTNEKRLLNRIELIKLLSLRLANMEKETLILGMESQGIPGGPIHNLQEVFETDQVSARDMKIRMPHELADSGFVELIGNPIKFSKTPVSYRHEPPVCGANTKEILEKILPE